MQVILGAKRLLLGQGKERGDGSSSRIAYLDSLDCESEKRYEQTWQIHDVEDRISRLREILAILQNGHHPSTTVIYLPCCIQSSCLHLADCTSSS